MVISINVYFPQSYLCSWNLFLYLEAFVLLCNWAASNLDFYHK